MRGIVLFSLAIACSPDKDDKPSPADGEPTDTVVEGCELPEGVVGCDAGASSPRIGCIEDFQSLASLPIDASIPGARSVKTVVDQAFDDTLYFMNSVRYPIHWEFAFNNLNAAQGFAPVDDLTGFNLTEYYSPDRRFVLGAVVYYEEADIWSYELAPYDTASADMVAKAFYKIRDNAYFGDKLAFHPSSEVQVNDVVPMLPTDIPIVTTDDLFVGVEYQAYNPGETTGLLTFRTAEEVSQGYTPFRELVVLDAIPIDISIVAGIITGEFQTPLAHINVLSINRGTPNMAVADAHTNPELLALEGKWVKLTVDVFEWSIEEITAEEAEEWWQANRPAPIGVPNLDLSVSELRDVEDIIADDADIASEVSTGLSIFGSKGTNYAGVYDIGQDLVPIQNAFVIPFYWYDQHMVTNGLNDLLVETMAKPEWLDPVQREQMLEAFKVEIVEAPLDPVFLQMVIDKAAAMWPNEDTRFRSSTNAEDLGNFTGAGLYNSQTGERFIPNPEEGSVEWAIKEAWANLWNPRAYEERSYYGIDQLGVAMALLTTPNFPEEEANGVAVTNNIFDTSGLEPGFFVNAQIDDLEVVQPEPGVLSDSYIHYFYTPGEPVVYISHSSEIPEGETVLSTEQIHDLGVALDAIHNHFRPVYGNDDDWYGMDVEWKFDDKYTPGTPALFLKQARPLPWNPGSNSLSVCPVE
jgi:pyruvate, water dikinase